MDESVSLVRRRSPVVAFAATTVVFVAAMIVLQFLSWEGNGELHTIMEVGATILAAMVGALALIRFYSKKNSTYLFLGAGFIGTALLDGYHAIVTSSFFHEIYPSPPESLIPWSWNASRTFLAVLMCLSWLAWRRERDHGEQGRVSEFRVYAATGIMALASFCFFAFFPLPRAYYPEFIFGRPEEFVAATFFAIALFGYVTKDDNRRSSSSSVSALSDGTSSQFELWVIASLLVGFVSQAFVMSRSFALFDLPFDLAHALKLVSYFLVLTGLMIDVQHLFGQLENARLSLEQTTTDMDEQRKQLASRVSQLKRFNSNMIGREKRIIALKQEVNALAIEAGQEPIHDIGFASVQSELGNQPTGERATGTSSNSSDSSCSEIALQDDGLLAALNLMEDANRDRTQTKAAEKRLQAIVEAAPNGMVMIDEDQKITMVNSCMETMFGYLRDELLGQPLDTLFPERHREKLIENISRYMRKPDLRTFGMAADIYGFHRNGRQIPIEISLSPIQLESGMFVLAVVTDLTEYKKTADTIKRTNESLRRSNHELEQFAYVASHDLQEPLRKMSSFCSLLAEEYGDKLEGDGQVYIRYVTDGAGRLRTLIQDLLAFSRISSLEADLSRIDANDALALAMENLEGAIEEVGAKVTHDDLPDVWAIERQFAQLLQNLIGNSIKYRGETRPKIHIGVHDRTADWEFFVSDNGIGIDREFHERIFGIFKRLHGKEKYGGTGIGLAICMRIVDRLGGKIWVESEEGQGSTFRFTIPKQRQTPLVVTGTGETHEVLQHE
jgi:PAS domain S-box-containing protein